MVWGLENWERGTRRRAAMHSAYAGAEPRRSFRQDRSQRRVRRDLALVERAHPALELGTQVSRFRVRKREPLLSRRGELVESPPRGPDLVRRVDAVTVEKLRAAREQRLGLAHRGDVVRQRG